MKKLVSRVLLLFGLILFASTPQLPAAVSSDTPITTEFKHTPLDYFVPGHRIEVKATVKDKQGVQLVRCYFKSPRQAEFVFVDMKTIKKHQYRGVLPAPSDYTPRIEYLFLSVNNNQQVIKTNRFTVHQAQKEVPDWQQIDDEATILVKTELEEAPESISGFSDSIEMDIVESSIRFGIVADGIYTTAAAASSAGGASGAAAAATSAGTVAATSAGISTAAVITTGAALAAAGAGAAAAASSGGSDGDSEINPNATISWGDEDTPAQDAFELVFSDESKGTNPTGTDGMTQIKGLPAGSHTLRITCVAAPEEAGIYTIILAGGASFPDGANRKTGTLSLNESRTYQVKVPELGTLEFQW